MSNSSLQDAWRWEDGSQVNYENFGNIVKPDSFQCLQMDSQGTQPSTTPFPTWINSRDADKCWHWFLSVLQGTRAGSTTTAAKPSRSCARSIPTVSMKGFFVKAAVSCSQVIVNVGFWRVNVLHTGACSNKSCCCCILLTLRFEFASVFHSSLWHWCNIEKSIFEFWHAKIKCIHFWHLFASEFEY